MTDETKYYDNKRYELYKPIDSKWTFTVYDNKGNVIGFGSGLTNKRMADNHAHLFIQYYRDTLS